MIFQFLRLYSAPRQVFKQPKDRSTSADPAASAGLASPRFVWLTSSWISDLTLQRFGTMLTGRTTESLPDIRSLICFAPTLWHLKWPLYLVFLHGHPLKYLLWANKNYYTITWRKINDLIRTSWQPSSGVEMRLTSNNRSGDVL